MQQGISVVVRFHSASRVDELKRCLFSVACQSFRPVEVLLCAQRFSDEDLAAVAESTKDVLAGSGVSLRTLNFRHAHPVDARSALINMGMQAAQYRYIAFLDYDDVIYPSAYEKLIGDLEASGCAVSFAKINVKHVISQNGCQISIRREQPFTGSNVIDLFRKNFCPIHSFVIDTAKVDASDLYFDKSMTRNEDYDFLIRLCASYPSSFALKEYLAGDYYCKSDGSNTILVQASFNEENIKAWKLAEDLVELRRNILFVAPEVQRRLGIEPVDPKLTVRTLLDRVAAERG